MIHKDNSLFSSCSWRSFQVRILKLAKSWNTMSSLLAAMGHSLGALANLSVILAIIIYIFAVVGMQLFGSSYTPEKFDGEIPRWRFTDFWHSFLLIFRIICGEWIEPLWDCMRAAGPASIILFIPAFILGHFIVSKQIHVSNREIPSNICIDFTMSV